MRWRLPNHVAAMLAMWGPDGRLHLRRVPRDFEEIEEDDHSSEATEARRRWSFCVARRVA